MIGDSAAPEASTASAAGLALDATRTAPGGIRQRIRHHAGTLALVALITLHELARRRWALVLALLLPLAFFLVRLDTYWTALRLLSMGLGWAAATLALFTAVSSRSVDRRLTVTGASPITLVLGRQLAVLGLSWGIGLLYSALALVMIGDQLTRPAAVPLMLLLTATAATPLGSLVAAAVPRDLEGALLLLAIMAVQVLVDPAESWTRVLPLWSARELATYILDSADAVAASSSGTSGSLNAGLAHGTAYGLALGTISWLLGVLRLRTIRLPEP